MTVPTPNWRRLICVAAFFLIGLMVIHLEPLYATAFAIGWAWLFTWFGW